MGRENHKGIIVVLFALFLCACVKDKPPGITNTVSNGTKNVYVVCEGNYGTGNGSLYEYQPAKDSVYGDIYTAVNGIHQWDVFQSMTRIGNNLFLVINNSGKVVVIDALSYKLITAINIPQPRYMLQVSDTKAYISTLYSNLIYIINPQTFTVTGTISLPSKSAEGMCMYNGYVFACSWDTAANHIYKIDGSTNQVIQSIALPDTVYAPQEVLLDKQQTLWVLSGNQPQGKMAVWTRIDPSTGDIIASYRFHKTADPLHPVFNSTKDTLYYVEDNYYGGTSDNGIYRMSIYDTALPTNPFIAAQTNQYFWGLGIDKLTGSIYVGDPKGFDQNGVVNIYHTNGTKISSFPTGVGPGHFYFDE